VKKDRFSPCPFPLDLFFPPFSGGKAVGARSVRSPLLFFQKPPFPPPPGIILDRFLKDLKGSKKLFLWGKPFFFPAAFSRLAGVEEAFSSKLFCSFPFPLFLDLSVFFFPPFPLFLRPMSDLPTSHINNTLPSFSSSSPGPTAFPPSFFLLVSFFFFFPDAVRPECDTNTTLQRPAPLLSYSRHRCPLFFLPPATRGPFFREITWDFHSVGVPQNPLDNRCSRPSTSLPPFFSCHSGLPPTPSGRITEGEEGMKPREGSFSRRPFFFLPLSPLTSVAKVTWCFFPSSPRAKKKERDEVTATAPPRKAGFLFFKAQGKGGHQTRVGIPVRPLLLFFFPPPPTKKR